MIIKFDDIIIIRILLKQYYCLINTFVTFAWYIIISRWIKQNFMSYYFIIIVRALYVFSNF